MGQRRNKAVFALICENLQNFMDATVWMLLEPRSAGLQSLPAQDGRFPWQSAGQMAAQK
jgi:hypothetical protein